VLVPQTNGLYPRGSITADTLGRLDFAFSKIEDYAITAVPLADELDTLLSRIRGYNTNGRYLNIPGTIDKTTDITNADIRTYIREAKRIAQRHGMLKPDFNFRDDPASEQTKAYLWTILNILDEWVAAPSRVNSGTPSTQLQTLTGNAKRALNSDIDEDMAWIFIRSIRDWLWNNQGVNHTIDIVESGANRGEPKPRHTFANELLMLRQLLSAMEDDVEDPSISSDDKEQLREYIRLGKAIEASPTKTAIIKFLPSPPPAGAHIGENDVLRDFLKRLGIGPGPDGKYGLSENPQVVKLRLEARERLHNIIDILQEHVDVSSNSNLSKNALQKQIDTAGLTFGNEVASTTSLNTAIDGALSYVKASTPININSVNVNPKDISAEPKEMPVPVNEGNYQMRELDNLIGRVNGHLRGMQSGEQKDGLEKAVAIAESDFDWFTLRQQQTHPYDVWHSRITLERYMKDNGIQFESKSNSKSSAGLIVVLVLLFGLGGAAVGLVIFFKKKPHKWQAFKEKTKRAWNGTKQKFSNMKHKIKTKFSKK